MGVLRDVAAFAFTVFLLFCIYETLNPEYERPPLKWRFKLFVVRVLDVTFFHVGLFLAGSLIAACGWLRDRLKS